MRAHAHANRTVTTPTHIGVFCLFFFMHSLLQSSSCGQNLYQRIEQPVTEMVVCVGLAVLCIEGLIVPRIVRYVRTKFHCSSGCPGPEQPQKNTLIVTLGFWPGALEENSNGSVDKANGLNQQLAVNISKSIYKEVIMPVSFSKFYHQFCFRSVHELT